MNSPRPAYHGYRFPPEIISHAVWLYHRFCLSFRDVEDLLKRGGGAAVKRKASGVTAATGRLSLRVPPDMIRRADILVPKMSGEAAAQGFTRITRSIVLKRAVLEGLKVLEARYR